MIEKIHIRQLGRREYVPVWEAMQEYALTRDENSPDELWCVEHPAVFTQGRNGKSEHLLNHQHPIPVVQTDRGGQITYHGPGQAVVYVLIDLKRRKMGVRELVSALELTTIQFLNTLGLEAQARKDAPGVYVHGDKIASLGLRVRRGCSYHGLSFNVDMDLTPFSWINPCGLLKQKVTQLSDFNIHLETADCGRQLARRLAARLEYTTVIDIES